MAALCHKFGRSMLCEVEIGKCNGKYNTLDTLELGQAVFRRLKYLANYPCTMLDAMTSISTSRTHRPFDIVNMPSNHMRDITKVTRAEESPWRLNG
jgi:hypothetical protein